MKTLAFFAALLITLGACTSTPQPSPFAVKTASGWIKGEPNADSTVTIYKGVPFAAPPVGDLRWKEPQPLTPWTDTLLCTKFGASPVQSNPVPFMMWTQEFITPAEPISEDCLYLNVWTPKQSDTDKLPVLVWIHGGGFISGSAACPVYDGEALAKMGIVYVSINYRLGVFGFTAHEQLTKESPHHASGNYAMLDQVAALQWVRDNIASFGGDPNKVTIAGQSAGSMAVQALVGSPLTQGLFVGAIAESGGLGSRPVSTLADAEKIGQSLSPDIALLRALPADTVLARASKLPFGTFSPMVDGYFLPEDPKSIFTNGKENQVNVITGWVTGDADLVSRPQSQKEFREILAKTFPGKEEAANKLFPSGNDESWKASQQKLALLQFAGAPGALWAASNRSKTYMYQYSYVPTDKPGFPNYGAFHTSEVPFALHTLAHWDRPWTQADLEVEKYMSAYWVNFVKTGNPNGAGLPEWPAYDRTSANIIDFNGKPTLTPGLYQEELEFIRTSAR